MIGGFPDLYPDELLYSGMARYADWMAYQTQKALSCDLFGEARVRAVLDLPNRLDYLISALPPGHCYTADKLIDQHTLWPYYAPFLPPERSVRVRQALHGDNRLSVYVIAGLQLRQARSYPILHFCPQCAVEDRQHYGETYWHRIAHIPAIAVCPVHQVWLEDIQSAYPIARKGTGLWSAERTIRVTSPRPLNLAEPTQRILLAIARDTAWLLDQAMPGIDPEAWRQRYIACLFERGLSTYNGRIHRGQLFETFQRAYPERLLRQLHCELHLHVGSPWPIHLVQHTSRPMVHPLHHVLMIHLLGHTLESFVQLPVERRPFGEGPWPCLNPAADHYRQACLSTLEVTFQKDDGLPVGTFTCSCGFSYSRTGPDHASDDRFHFDSVKTTGPVWDNLLRQLWYAPDATFKAMQRRLNISWHVLRKHALRLNLPFPPPGFPATCVISPPLASPTTSRSRKQHDPAPYRIFWLAIIEQYPHTTLTELSRRFPYEVYWLRQYDREWFFAHRPTPEPYNRSQPRIDWAERDSQVANEIAAIAQQLKQVPGRPFRISRSLLLDSVAMTTVVKERVAQLPLTLQAVRDFEETHEDCAIRRIWWCTEQFRQEGKCPTRTQLAVRAGVQTTTRLGRDTRVQATLRDALKSFQ